MDYAASTFQIKSLDDSGVIEGLGAFFGNEDLGGDIIRRGAFAKTLADRAGAPLPMLFCHDQRRPIGAWTEVAETAEGLAVKGRLTLAARDGQEAYALAKDGALSGLSIGYEATKESFNGRSRVLEAVKLFEVSPVPVPMNERAVIQRVKAIQGVRDIEELLHESGLSGRKAKAAATAAWRAINQHDDETAADAELAALFEASAKRIAAL